MVRKRRSPHGCGSSPRRRRKDNGSIGHTRAAGDIGFTTVREGTRRGVSRGHSTRPCVGVPRAGRHSHDLACLEPAVALWRCGHRDQSPDPIAALPSRDRGFREDGCNRCTCASRRGPHPVENAKRPHRTVLHRSEHRSSEQMGSVGHPSASAVPGSGSRAGSFSRARAACGGRRETEMRDKPRLVTSTTLRPMRLASSFTHKRRRFSFGRRQTRPAAASTITPPPACRIVA